MYKKLLIKVKNSDTLAFKKLFSDYHDTLFRFVIYKTRDSDLAEDITQETFLRVWKSREKIIPEKSFFSLIARISTNLCYDHFRHLEVRNRHKDQIPDFAKSHYDIFLKNTYLQIYKSRLLINANNKFNIFLKNFILAWSYRSNEKAYVNRRQILRRNSCSSY